MEGLSNPGIEESIALVHSQVTFLHSVGLVFSIRDDEREKKM
jgi:hypothetical protein